MYHALAIYHFSSCEIIKEGAVLYVNCVAYLTRNSKNICIYTGSNWPFNKYNALHSGVVKNKDKQWSLSQHYANASGNPEQMHKDNITS